MTTLLFENFQDRVREYLSPLIADPRKTCVAGGFFPRFYHNLPIRDIDIFVLDKNDFASIAHEYTNNKSFTPKMIGEHFIKFDYNNEFEVDLIGFKDDTSAYGIVRHWDFSIAQLNFYNNDLINYNLVFNDIVNKRLQWTGNLLLDSKLNNSFTRFIKYKDLGFKPSNEVSFYMALHNTIEERFKKEGVYSFKQE